MRMIHFYLNRVKKKNMEKLESRATSVKVKKYLEFHKTPVEKIHTVIPESRNCHESKKYKNFFSLLFSITN